MSVYKVAQDVEADDKLIGPFSFRQFIYLLIVAISIGLGWALFQVAPPLVIIVLPFILFFGALALPLKKDQPMEVYLAAVVSFHLKPKKRLWTPDGVQSLVEITAPKVIEKKYTKDISESEADKRFAYLASIMDTQGWAVRDPSLLNSQLASHDTAMINDVYNEAQQAEDLLDETGGVSLSFENKMAEADNRRRQEIMNRMHNTAGSINSSYTTPTPAPQQNNQTPPVMQQPAYQPVEQTPTQPPQITQPTSYIAAPTPKTEPELAVPEKIEFNPYPTQMHQSVIQPSGGNQEVASTQNIPIAQPETYQSTLPSPAQSDNVTPSSQIEDQSTSEIKTTPDIINLANNSDLSIETIAHEAHRIKDKKLDDGDEVIISLH